MSHRGVSLCFLSPCISHKAATAIIRLVAFIPFDPYLLLNVTKCRKVFLKKYNEYPYKSATSVKHRDVSHCCCEPRHHGDTSFLEATFVTQFIPSSYRAIRRLTLPPVIHAENVAFHGRSSPPVSPRLSPSTRPTLRSFPSASPVSYDQPYSNTFN